MPPTITGFAGALATALFVISTLPMLIKAARTKDLASYSGSNLLIANIGNVAHAIYLTSITSLPIWALHLFNTTVSAAMLILWICHRYRSQRQKSLGWLTGLCQGLWTVPR